MWLNVVILAAASLVVGFVLGWVVACPRRWEARFADRPAPREETPPFSRLTGRLTGRV
ncbi:hypothetical protein GCM10009678_90570 [Actinomadura kijaniata]|uniref:Uncharacterized protein n=1 Tax=Actinomadura namibiensis TaxID=182080 RepID=A0A7W3QNN9_ACTNM|nr:hypothetical protein [Actinomadura namibiensis]MBA8953771.1 hypothetical protein [Actinomadura namibiensis]